MKKKKEIKIKQIYGTEFNKDTYLIAVTEDGKLLRAIHKKKNGETVWEQLPVLTPHS